MVKKPTGTGEDAEIEQAPTVDKPSEGSSQLTQHFMRIYYDFLQALQFVWMPKETQYQVVGAYRDYVQSLQATQADIQQRTANSFNKYALALQEMSKGADVQPQIGEAYTEYIRSLQDIWSQSDAQRQFTEAYRDYLQALGSAYAPSNTPQRVAEAYRDYLKAVQETWQQADVVILDPNSLAVIGQSLAAAAWEAASASAMTRQTLTSYGINKIVDV